MAIFVYGLGVTGESALRFYETRGIKTYYYTDQGQDAKNSFATKVESMDEIVWEELDYVLKSPGIRQDTPFLLEARKHRLPIYSDLEIAYRYLDKEKIIAITGTNGKTTTVSLLTHILQECGYQAKACGNIGYPVLSCLDEDLDYLVLEASSFQLSSVEDFAPHRAAILNIQPDHLEWHSNMEEYIQAKFAIAKKQTKEDLIFLNPRDEITKSGFFMGQIHWVDFSNKIKSQLFGKHNEENIAFAYDIARSLGLEDEKIRKAILSFKAVAHRLEPVGEVCDVLYINDSKATNIDATVKAMEAMKRSYHLICGGYDKHLDFKPLMEAFQGKSLILLGETKKKLREKAEEFSLQSMTFSVEDLEEAVFLAFERAKKGEIVLFSPACASWDMYPNFEVRGQHFKDLVKRLGVKQ